MNLGVLVEPRQGTKFGLTYLSEGDLKNGLMPVAGTFWRYVDSLGINHTNLFLKIFSVPRERVWQLCDINYYFNFAVSWWC